MTNQDQRLVQPIDVIQRAEVLAATAAYIDLAARELCCDLLQIPVVFDLSGRAAGMFRAEAERCWIRYNPWIFGKYYRQNLDATVPHEVAHYVVYALFDRRRVKPHGKQWRQIMALFDADPGVTFDLDLRGIPQRGQRTHAYRCPCRDHQLSTTRHNRINSGRSCYRCRFCDGELVYID